MRGVINVRGHVVPIVDLRRKFDLKKAETTVDTCMIIVELDVDGEAATMGALVDGVQEVLETPPEMAREREQKIYRNPGQDVVQRRPDKGNNY